MLEIECWFCEHFDKLSRSRIYDENIINGVCTFDFTFCHMKDKACKKFVLRSDVRLNKTICDLCDKLGFKKD